MREPPRTVPTNPQALLEEPQGHPGRHESVESNGAVELGQAQSLALRPFDVASSNRT